LEGKKEVMGFILSYLRPRPERFGENGISRTLKDPEKEGSGLRSLLVNIGRGAVLPLKALMG